MKSAVDRYAAAVNAAAIAVVLEKYGLWVGRVMLEPPGSVIYQQPLSGPGFFVREIEILAAETLVGLYAGLEAVCLLAPSVDLTPYQGTLEEDVRELTRSCSPRGSKTDGEAPWQAIAYDPQAEAHDQVRRHEGAIRLVAQALLEQGTLSRAEMAALVAAPPVKGA